MQNCDFRAVAPLANGREFLLPFRPSRHQAIPGRLHLLPFLSQQDRSGSEASAQLQRLASSFRTAAAELPTLSTIFCNSARDIPSSLVQCFTSQLSCMLILLRSGASRFVKLSIATPSNIFVDRQTRANAWSIGRVLENLATLRSQLRFRWERDAKLACFQFGDRQ